MRSPAAVVLPGFSPQEVTPETRSHRLSGAAYEARWSRSVLVGSGRAVGQLTVSCWTGRAPDLSAVLAGHPDRLLSAVGERHIADHPYPRPDNSGQPPCDPLPDRQRVARRLVSRTAAGPACSRAADARLSAGSTRADRRGAGGSRARAGARDSHVGGEPACLPSTSTTDPHADGRARASATAATSDVSALCPVPKGIQTLCVGA